MFFEQLCEAVRKSWRSECRPDIRFLPPANIRPLHCALGRSPQGGVWGVTVRGSEVIDLATETCPFPFPLLPRVNNAKEHGARPIQLTSGPSSTWPWDGLIHWHHSPCAVEDDTGKLVGLVSHLLFCGC